jgi:hypothetical protein
MKYIVCKEDGTPLKDPHDNQPEPCFVIRAQDAFALMAIQAYINIVQGTVREEMMTDLKAHQETIRGWQRSHRTKIPD